MHFINILWPSFDIFYTTLIHNWDSVPNLDKWTSGDYYLNSLWPLSHLGVTCFRPEILACKNNNQILQTMDKRLTVPRWVQQFGRKYPKCPYIFRPNLSAQAQKFGIFGIKALSGFPSVLCSKSMRRSWLTSFKNEGQQYSLLILLYSHNQFFHYIKSLPITPYPLRYGDVIYGRPLS